MIFINSGMLSSFGVGLDIIGAFFLAQGFIVKNLEKTIIESSDYMDGNPYRVRSAIHQRIDAWTGFTFLSLGFLLQFISNFAFVHRGENHSLGPMLAFLIALLLFAISMTRPLKKRQSTPILKEKFVRRASLEMMTKSAMKSEEQIRETAKFYGEVIYVYQSEDEPTQEYVERVLKELH